MRHHWILCANFFLIIIIITRIQLLYKTMLAELIKIKINYWQHDREGGGYTGNEEFEIFTCANSDRQAFGASAKDSLLVACK